MCRADPSRFGRLTALFDEIGIDLLCGDAICFAAGLVSIEPPAGAPKAKCGLRSMD
jgi:hypothetical protein